MAVLMAELNEDFQEMVLILFVPVSASFKKILLIFVHSSRRFCLLAEQSRCEFFMMVC